MLPFMKKNKDASVAGLIIKMRKPDEKAPSDQEEPKDDSAIHECAAELIRAVHAQDPKGVANALKDAFDILDSQPHEEAQSNEPQETE